MYDWKSVEALNQELATLDAAGLPTLYRKLVDKMRESDR